MTCVYVGIAAVAFVVAWIVAEVASDLLDARRRKAREEAWRSLKGPVK